MKVKSLAMGMILPLAASVAVSTAPAASAAPAKSAFTQSAVPTNDHRYGGNEGRHGGNYGEYRHRRGGYYNDYRRGYYHDRYQFRRSYYSGLWCTNYYRGWHRHYSWRHIHPGDQCYGGGFAGGHRRSGPGGGYGDGGYHPGW